jgi:caa(3)-type oxidase subunit IV
VLPHIVPDVTNVLGLFTVPYSIYDVVFVSLAIFTVIEVVVGAVLQHSAITVLLLLTIAFVKAAHVVLYYMHLSQDSRIFWLTLLLPLFIAVLGTIYLIAVPVRGY